MAYLDDHPPARRQFRPRTMKPTGLIVLHTGESILDVIGPDAGAENLAAWISHRTDPGSYHRIADADSVVDLVRFDQAAYGDGTGSNDFAIHISFACKAADWAGMSEGKRLAFIRQGAKAAAEAAEWLHATYRIEVPPARVTRIESDRGEPGFISHAERDPGRRTDPGADFPWPLFMREFVEAQVDRDAEIRKRLNAAMREVKAAEGHAKRKPRVRFWLAKMRAAGRKVRKINRGD